MKKRLIIFVSIIIILSCFIIWPVLKHNAAPKKIKCELLQVVDGDTIKVLYQGKQSSVRLIGIDTPESVHTDESKNNRYGDAASIFTKDLLSGIEYVYLEFDVSPKDNYDRLLAYVYLQKNCDNFKDSLNYIIVDEGYGVDAAFIPNVKYAGELEAACMDAEEQRRGLWGKDGFNDLWK